MKKEEIKKILIIRFGAIGDLLHTSEVFRSIKRKYPQIEIHYLAFKLPSQIIQYDKDLSKIIVAKDKSYKTLWELAKELKKEKYDLILNLQPSNRTKFLCFFSFPKKVLTYKKSFKFHAVENFWQTAQKFFKNLDLKQELELNIPQSAIDKVKELLPPDRKIVTINVFAAAARQGRRWEKENFKKLALKLIDEYNCTVVVSGAPDEVNELEDFNGLNENIVVLAGKLSLIESCALYSLSDLMISPDTGPLHLASASNGPICIGLYGAMPIARTGVWGMKHYNISADLPCIPCNRRKCRFKKGQYNPCLEAISVETVFDIVKNYIWVQE